MEVNQISVTTVEEVLKYYNREWDLEGNSLGLEAKSKPKDFELLPSLETESPNVQGIIPTGILTASKSIWGMSYEIAKETLEYIDRLKTKVYIACIENGKLKNFLLFNPKGEIEEYKPYFKKIDYGLKWDKKDLDKIKRNPWKIMGCILKEEKVESEDSANVYLKILNRLFEKHPEGLPIKNGMYIFSVRDLVLVNKEGNEPWVDVVGYGKKLGFIPKTFLPVLNSTGEKNSWDIPIPTYEDWRYVNNPTVKANFDDLILDWKKKKPTSVFRGGSTGCGYDARNNVRIALAKLSLKLKAQGKSDFRGEPLLDAGITAGAKKFKFHRDTGLGFFSMEAVKLKPASFLSKKEQSAYKYIIYAEGNVSAHRLATDMLLGSVILFVESEYTLWFEHLLKEYQHYIKIKRDLSDLEEKILWCRANDDICEQIGKNNRQFALDLLQKDVVLNVIGNCLIHCL